MKTIHMMVYAILIGMCITCLSYAIKEHTSMLEYKSLEQELHNSFESYLRTSSGKIDPMYVCKVK